MITITEPNAVSREFDESIAPAVIRAWFATHGTPNDVLALSVRPRHRGSSGRGGSWFHDAWGARSACRYDFDSGYHSVFLSFRLCFSELAVNAHSGNVHSA